jgi:hypothetical protein
MIELLIAACLSTSASECRDFSERFEPYEMSLMTCTIHGQNYIAAWNRSHPDWTVARWSCGYIAPGRADI